MVGTAVFRRIWIGVMVGALTAACGGAEFGGSGGRQTQDLTKDPRPGSKPDPEPKDKTTDDPEPSDSKSPISALTWFWQCDAAPVDPPKAGSPTEVVVQGQGPHQFEREQLDGTTVTFSGRLCEPDQLPRDIVFVIDTSGSMAANDPRVGDSCGRLAAIESVIAATPSGSARFGVVSFGTTTVKASSQLYETKAALYADLAPTGSMADVVCAAPFDALTNYNAALTSASTLLSGARANATKEIYFVSDGAPTGGQNGDLLAATLKSVGVQVNSGFVPVTIATVMLLGNDQILENKIASRDANGKPLHAFVTQTDQLAKVLTELAANEIVGAELKYRSIGASTWTTVDILDHLQGFDFTLPSITIDLDAAQNGLEVLYEYRDKRDQRVTTGGKLLWTVSGGGD